MKKPFWIIIFPLSIFLIFGITASGKEDQKAAEYHIKFNSSLVAYQTDFQIDQIAADIKAEEIKRDQKRKESRYIKNIPLPREMQEYIWSLAADQAIDPYLIIAIIEVESEYEEKALSVDGMDYGLMQIRQINHSRVNKKAGYRLNYMDGKDNVKAGIILLEELYGRYYKRSGLHCVLMAYNQGEASAQQSWNNGVFSTRYSWEVVSVYKKIKCLGNYYSF